MPDKKIGSLEVICGSMFSGKTEELIRLVRRAEYAKQKTLTIKHKLDDLRKESFVAAHSGKSHKAHSIANKIDDFRNILVLADDEVSVVALDEVQFFPRDILAVIQELVMRGKRVIAAGLDLDFRGEPFGIVPTLLALADKITKLTAICVKCGKEGHHTQRIINGEPANYDDPVIMIGSEEYYEARCRQCFVIQGPEKRIWE